MKIEASGTDVFLNAGEYLDLTTAADGDKFNLAADYYPITYTLTKNGAATPVVTGKLDAIIDYLNGLNGLNGLSKNYPANTDLTSEIGEYKLSWEWKFEGGNDKADTLLGAITAGGMTTLPTLGTYGTGVHLILTATVTQID